MIYHSLVHMTIYDMNFIAEPTENAKGHVGQGVEVKHIFKFKRPQHLKITHHEVPKLILGEQYNRDIECKRKNWEVIPIFS